MDKYTSLPTDKLASEHDAEKEVLLRQQIDLHKKLANKRSGKEDNDKSRE
jgi:hypothetical protein